MGLRPQQVADDKQCAKSTVTRAVQRGELESKNGWITEESARNWEPKERRPKSEASQLKLPTAPPANGDLTPLRRKQIVDAERSEAQWRREQGLVIDRDEVVALLRDFSARVRKELQSLPRRMHSDLARKVRCRKCGGDVDGNAIAIAAEKYIDTVLHVLAADPLAGKR